MRKNTDDLRNQNINYREKLTGKIHTPVINYCDCSDTLEQIINKINELNELYNGLNYTIGEFTPTGNYSNIVEFIKYTGSVLLKKIIELQEEFENYDNTEILELISNLSQEIVELNNIFDSIIGDFEPSSEYSTITEWIQYVHNLLQSIIYNLMDELDYTKDNLIKLTERVDNLEIESSEHDNRIVLLENRVSKMEYMLSYLTNKVDNLYNLLGKAEIAHSVKDNVLILPNELTIREPE